MRELAINVSIPRLSEEESIIKESIQLLDSFFEECENSPEKIVESDIQSFFGAYNKLEKIKEELVLSQWAQSRELGKSVDDILNSVKNRFDELDITITCKTDFDRIDILKTFDQIRTVF